MFAKRSISRKLVVFFNGALILCFLVVYPRDAFALLSNGVDPNNLGQGDWIWEMPNCETALGVSTPQAVIDYEASNGMQWVCVKAGDGVNEWSQWNSTVINEAHAKGMKIFAWVYAAGNDSSYSGGATTEAQELAVAEWALSVGGDGLIIDAETEYQGQPAAASAYAYGIKQAYPNMFLAYAPFPYISDHSTFPYIQFGTNCDAVMPQDYWADIGVSLTNMVNDMDGEWTAWQNSLTGFNTNAIKPIIPIGQAWNSSGYTEKAADITNFVWLLKNDPVPACKQGYHGISYWECSQQPAAAWAGMQSAVILAGTNSMTVAQSSNATFSVNLPSGGNYTYQWKLNGANISGATSSSYTVTNAQLGNAGIYSVYAFNPVGCALNYSTVLSVIGTLTNAPDAVLAPVNMINWWAGEGNSFDIFGVTNATPNAVHYTSGKTGLSMSFNGGGSYLATGAPGLAPPWTLCMWVNRQNAPGVSAALMSDTNAYILKLEQSPTTREVGITEQSVQDFVFTNSSGTHYSVPQNTWTHLAFVDNGSQVQLYANGVSEGSLSLNFPLPRALMGVDSFSSTDGVGSNPGRKYTDYLLGSLDDVLTFNRALSASEIASIYNAGSAGLVRAPEFTSLTNLASGQIQINIIGQTGKSVTLRSSSDLINWSTLVTVPNTFGATNYTDSTVSPQKFYQATQKY